MPVHYLVSVGKSHDSILLGWSNGDGQDM